MAGDLTRRAGCRVAENAADLDLVSDDSTDRRSCPASADGMPRLLSMSREKKDASILVLALFDQRRSTEAAMHHRLPFENRWTNGKRGWQWHQELERVGAPNVRAMFALHEVEHPSERCAVADVPAGFVRDWLAYKDLRTRRHAIMWAGSVMACSLAAAGASLMCVFR